MDTDLPNQAAAILQVAADLQVSIAAAGPLISGYALGVFVGAPVLTVATRRMPRKTVLVAPMVIFTIGNIACANLRETHRWLESGSTIGKLVLVGW